MDKHLPLISLRVSLLPAAALFLGLPCWSQGADPSEDAFKMGSPPALPEGKSEEQIWTAATAEGWKKPVLVPWQRSFDDALQVAKDQNRPIMVAVNMDGEIASEHFAGVRYRDPETAALLDPYVCVIASVYRHTTRDYDENGKRVECPRFGIVTCGEHIQAERELYGKYFDGRRISPRHIVLDTDGGETYDVFYAWDTATVLRTYVKGAEGWPEPNPDPELTLENIARSPDSEKRLALERAYDGGDVETRRQILRTLIEKRRVDQVEVLRAAIFGFDLELASLAREALAQCDTEGALDLMAESLKAPLAPEERTLLLSAVERMAGASTRARTLLALHQGISIESSEIDPGAIASIAREYEDQAGPRLSVDRLEEEAVTRPGDPVSKLAFAEALLARSAAAGGGYSDLFLVDAEKAVREARAAGASGPRLEALLAVLASRRGEDEGARRHAVAAVEGGLLQSEGDAPSGLDERSLAAVLRHFAEARTRAIRAAYRAGESWPPEWLADVQAAYGVVEDGPAADSAVFLDHHDILRWLGATPRANQVLDAGLERFPESPDLHARLRGRLLWEGGPRKLQDAYALRLENATEDQGDSLPWFAGYASLVAAEHHRRRTEFPEAMASYARGADLYRRYVDSAPERADDGHHYITMALAGRARVALENDDLGLATEELVTALELRPASAGALDGLGFSPAMTAKMLHASLLKAGQNERLLRLQGLIDRLDPAAFPPPVPRLPDELRGR